MRLACLACASQATAHALLQPEPVLLIAEGLHVKPPTALTAVVQGVFERAQDWWGHPEPPLKGQRKSQISGLPLAAPHGLERWLLEADHAVEEQLAPVSISKE